MIKYGKTKLGNQRYQCKSCNKTRVGYYRYKAYESTIDQNIILLKKFYGTTMDTIPQSV